MDIATLQGAVDAAFAVTGASTPPWPDPHPNKAPADEEYSRCLDPGRYRILAARVDAWTQVLTSAGLAAVEPVPDVAGVWRDEVSRKPVTAVWVHPARTGALPLLVGYRPLDDVADAIVVLGAGRPAVLLTELPFCGCDACDDGSAYLLGELDEHIAAVVSGALVQVTTPSGTVVTTGRGWTADGRLGSPRDIEGLLERARRGQSQYRTVAGVAWY
jgi:hypothetical protein